MHTPVRPHDQIVSLRKGEALCPIRRFSRLFVAWASPWLAIPLNS